jgi:prevent-host-death family protein
MQIMEKRVAATELARRLGDILNRVRYRGETFVVERNGKAVARIVPIPGAAASLRAAFDAWRAAGEPDPAFADDLARIGAADRVPEDPWTGQRDSS